MKPKDERSETYRLWDLSAGRHWIVDDQRMLFACLSNSNPKEAHLLDEFTGTIPANYADVAKVLYQVVSESPELEGLASDRICAAIDDFLATVLSSTELSEFKRQHPRSTKPKYANILEEMADEGRI
jgi:hypothetical protein